jgi:hypothetical protein
MEARLAKATNPRHRRMLEIVLAHGRAEVEADVDGLMATLNDNPEYHFWTARRRFGLSGRDEVRKYYEDFVRAGEGYFQSEKTRIVVDDEAVVTEAVYTYLVPASVARKWRVETDDPKAHYRLQTRGLVIWPFDEKGGLVGEDTYTSGVLSAERVPDHEIPRDYLQMLEKIGLLVA